MNVVDSSAWLEYFAAGPNAARFSAVIGAVESLIVPTVVLLEVTRRILQQRNEAAAYTAAAALRQGRLVDLDGDLAFAAAQLGVARRLPLADCIILATARRFDATLWTMDADFDGQPGVRYFSARPTKSP